MNHIRLLAFGSVLVLAFSAAAQQTTTSPEAIPDTHAAASAALTPVEQHLKMLSEKLGLTAEQQAHALPILQQMQDGSQKLEDDPTLTADQRRAAMHPLFMKADQQMRAFLSEDQKKKLDEMEAQMHQEHHGGPDGTSAAPPQN